MVLMGHYLQLFCYIDNLNSQHLNVFQGYWISKRLDEWQLCISEVTLGVLKKVVLHMVCIYQLNHGKILRTTLQLHRDRKVFCYGVGVIYQYFRNEAFQSDSYCQISIFISELAGSCSNWFSFIINFTQFKSEKTQTERSRETCFVTTYHKRNYHISIIFRYNDSVLEKCNRSSIYQCIHSYLIQRKTLNRKIPLVYFLSLCTSLLLFFIIILCWKFHRLKLHFV